MVEEPLSLTYEQLVARPLIERDVTLACVSNRGSGVGTWATQWVGVPLADLLSAARFLPGADQLRAGRPTAGRRGRRRRS